MNQFDFQRSVMASNLDGTTRWILVAIGSHVNWKTGAAAFPSIATLVKETGFSKATIHRAKIKLVSEGYLVSQRHFNKSNTYLVQIPDSLTQRLGSLTERPGSLTERLGWSHSEELTDNITDNIKENITDKEKIINKFSDENLFRDFNNKKARKKIIIESETPALASFKAQTAAAEIWEQTPDNIKKFWQEQGI